jgi:hypothetical protein
MLVVHLHSSDKVGSYVTGIRWKLGAGVGPKTKKPRMMAGLENGHKKPGSGPGSTKRRAAFTATHAAMKTELFRAEK